MARDAGNRDLQPTSGPNPDSTNAPSPLRDDEGFSETVGESIEEDELTAVNRQHYEHAWNWLVSLDDPTRAEFARRLLMSLPTSIISNIVADANSRLHFDPVAKLPPELYFHVLSFLDPNSLINSSAVSKAWHVLAGEPRLWRSLFRLEGWTVDLERIAAFEAHAELRVAMCRGSFYRSKNTEFFDSASFSWRQLQQGAWRVWVSDAKLGIQPGKTAPQPWEKSWEEPLDSDDDMVDIGQQTASEQSERQSGSAPPNSPFCPLVTPRQILSKNNVPARLDWHYLYKQRRRLESNWTHGRFRNFRLPRADRPAEAHTQCIYTIQFSANHLVSGSRDRTVRVWDLHHQTLKYPPLKGHEGSVLCLQFDEAQNIIISGGSDSNVIIWNLRDGSRYKKISHAHAESVLNLRFDDRYLVTCSKDKTIKVWNRKPNLMPDDADYPATNRSRNARYPSYIINQQEYLHGAKRPAMEPLQDYSLLMQFEGHGAAVNAIQIHNNHIVSASGDRKIILWDIKTGNLIRTFTGHSKGIACVQYDGRRIISGSSDNTVRIYDSSTAAEVAVLDGHKHLVRTVQADFGDVTGDEEQDEAQAKENDKHISLQKRQHSFFPQAATWPQRYFVYGAKLPPGGGGNQWSKIVSGSYDETIIIWRRSEDGTWVVAKELRHDVGLNATMPRVPHQQQQPPLQIPTDAATGLPTHQGLQASPNTTSAILPAIPSQADHPNDGSGQFDKPVPPGVAPNAPFVGTMEPAATGGQPSAPVQTAPALMNSSANDAAYEEYLQHVQRLEQQQQQQLQQEQYQQLLQQHLQQQQPPQQQQVQQQPQPPVPNGARPMDGPGASRVFKLQFDARRIVCCSQQTVIVGWDFADNDPDIIEASQFFGQPSA